MSFVSCKYLFVCLTVLFVNSSQVWAKCRRFDDKVIENIQYSQLSGKWNIIYSTSPVTDASTSFVYSDRIGDSLRVDVLSNGRESKGTITHLNDKRKILSLNNVQATYWIMRTDYNKFLFTYQCQKPVLVNGTKQAPEIFRLLSRTETIEPYIYQATKLFLRAVSKDISLVKVDRTDAKIPVIGDLPSTQTLKSSETNLEHRLLMKNKNHLAVETIPGTSDSHDQIQSPLEKLEHGENLGVEKPKAGTEPLRTLDHVEPENKLTHSDLGSSQIRAKPVVEDVKVHQEIKVHEEIHMKKELIQNKHVLDKVEKDMEQRLVKEEETGSPGSLLSSVTNEHPSHSQTDSVDNLLQSRSEETSDVLKSTPLVEQRLAKDQETGSVTPESLISSAMVNDGLDHSKEHSSNSQTDKLLLSRSEEASNVLKSTPVVEPIVIPKRSSQSPPKIRCRKFEAQSIKDMDFGSFAGHWNLLYSTVDEGQCPETVTEHIDANKNQINKYVNCQLTSKANITKTPGSRKLTIIRDNVPINTWMIDIGSKDTILVYNCFKPNSDPKSQVSDVYIIYSRKTVLEQREIDTITAILSKLVINGLTLRPAVRNNCVCGQQKDQLISAVDSTLPSKDSKAVVVPAHTAVSFGKDLLLDASISSILDPQLEETQNEHAQLDNLVPSSKEPIQADPVLDNKVPSLKEPIQADPVLDNKVPLPSTIEAVPEASKDEQKKLLIEPEHSELSVEVPAKTETVLTVHTEPNGCPQMDNLAMPDFNIGHMDKLSGEWLLQYWNAAPTIAGKSYDNCVTFELGTEKTRYRSKIQKGDPNIVKRWINIRDGDDLFEVGTLVFNRASKELTSQLSGDRIKHLHLLDTDIQHYMIVYRCNPDIHEIWTMTRTASDMSPNLIAKTKVLATKLGISATMRIRDNDVCSLAESVVDQTLPAIDKTGPIIDKNEPTIDHVDTGAVSIPVVHDTLETAKSSTKQTEDTSIGQIAPTAPKPESLEETKIVKESEQVSNTLTSLDKVEESHPTVPKLETLAEEKAHKSDLGVLESITLSPILRPQPFGHAEDPDDLVQHEHPPLTDLDAKDKLSHPTPDSFDEHSELHEEDNLHKKEHSLKDGLVDSQDQLSVAKTTVHDETVKSSQSLNKDPLLDSLDEVTPIETIVPQTHTSDNKPIVPLAEGIPSASKGSVLESITNSPILRPQPFGDLKDIDFQEEPHLDDTSNKDSLKDSIHHSEESLEPSKDSLSKTASSIQKDEAVIKQKIIIEETKRVTLLKGDQNEVTKSSLNKNDLSSKDSIESVNLQDCPVVPYVPALELELEKLNGYWYLLHSTSTKCTNCTYAVVSMDDPDTDLMQIRRPDNKNVVLDIDETSGELYYVTENDGRVSIYILDTDYTNYMIFYSCVPNKQVTMNMWSRKKQSDDIIFNVFKEALVKYKMVVPVIPIYQDHCDIQTIDIKKTTLVDGSKQTDKSGVQQLMDSTSVQQSSGQAKSEDELTCRSMAGKALVNVDMNRLRGTWYSIMLNYEGVRCFVLRENNTVTGSPDEYWFDIISEKGNQGLARLKSVQDKVTFTMTNIGIENNFYILDTDYLNYFVYYNCYFLDISGYRKKIVEFGVMSRTPALDQPVINRAVTLFIKLGLAPIYPVIQKNCAYNGMPVSQKNYCRSIDKIGVKRVELDQMMGKWLAMYSLTSKLTDVWIEIDRNPESAASGYTHTMQMIFDDEVVKTYIKVDEETGYLMAMSDNQPVVGDFQLAVFDVDYNSEMILYQCLPIKGSFSRLERVTVFSRNCQLSSAIVDRANAKASQLRLTDQFTPKLHQIKQFNCLQDHRYQTRLLSETCTHFHDSEIVEADLTRMVGQWDRHLVSNELHFKYDYAIGSYNKKGVLDFDIQPSKIHSRKSLIEGTNMLRSLIVSDLGPSLGNEAIIAIDYDSFFLKYLCVQHEVNGHFTITELINLSLRPRTSALLAKNPDLVLQILNNIPEKSLNKIKPLIDKLVDQRRPNAVPIGHRLAPIVEQRLIKYRKNNLISDKPDKQVYQFLNKICRHFDEDEQFIFDMESIVLSNWTVEYSSKTERISFDRMVIHKASNLSYQTSLYKGDQLLAYSDRYYDPIDRIFWAFTDGRRAIQIYLFSTEDYRLSYSCEEQFINGQLTANEFLRLYSSRENPIKPRDWFSYLELLVANLKPKTLGKISDLLENMIAFSKHKSLVTKSIKTLWTGYLTPKVKFEDFIRKERPTKKRRNDIAADFEALKRSCKFFEDQELIEPDLKNMVGTWRIDWTNWMDRAAEPGLYVLDFTMETSGLSSIESKINQKRVKLALSKGYYKKTNDDRHLQKIAIDGRKGHFSILWTDYDNYMIVHLCLQNDINGIFAPNEALILFSRMETKRRDLETYIDLIGRQLQQITIAKIYHLLNSLIPIDANMVGEDMRAMHDLDIKTKHLFTEDIYYNFLAKGLVVKKINKLIVGRESKYLADDSETLATLTRVCRRFNQNELVAPTPTNLLNQHQWSIDWTTRTMFLNFGDYIAVETNSSSIIHKQYLDNELMHVMEMKPIGDTKWIRYTMKNGRRGIVGIIYFDSQIHVSYSCIQNVINGIVTGKELLLLVNHDTTLPKDLDFYVNKLIAGVKPNTLSKISDMLANLRPVYSTTTKELILNAQRHQISVRNEVMNTLSKECLYFNHKDLVEPELKRLSGKWRVRLANYIDFVHPYDTIEWIDRCDRFEAKLRNKAVTDPGEASKFVCKGKLRQVDDTNSIEEVFDGVRQLEAILYTDYSDLMVIYSCKQTPDSMGVLENLKLLVRKESPKVAIDKRQFQILLSNKLIPYVYTQIIKFIPTLNYVYNSTVNDHIEVTEPVPEAKSVILLPKVSQPEQSDQVSASLVQPVITKQVEQADPLAPAVLSADESCPNLDQYAQLDVDFSRLTGRWDAVYSSNSRWDKDCIFTVDIYDRSTDSLIQTKYTGGKKHRVVVRHKSRSRQETIVDNIIFESWTLATDYSTYRLAHTCYIKEINGKKKRIDLQRLYTRGIEAKDMDQSIVQQLRVKAALVGKTLEPIDRSKCEREPNKL